jgi:hypothetical protein
MDEDVYSRQTFGRALGFGKRPALLIVDFVNGFLDPEQFGGGNIADAARMTISLLAAARTAASSSSSRASSMPRMARMQGSGAKRCRASRF